MLSRDWTRRTWNTGSGLQLWSVQGRWRDGRRFASPDFQMRNVGAVADARAPQRAGWQQGGGWDDSKGTRVLVRNTRMSCRMTLIDNVAPFGLFSWRPFGKLAQQTGFPADPTRLEWIQSTPSLCSPVSSPFLAWPLSLFIAIVSLYYLNQVTLFSKYGASHIVTSVCCTLLSRRCVSQPPNLQFMSWSVDLRLTRQQSSPSPQLSSSVAT